MSRLLQTGFFLLLVLLVINVTIINVVFIQGYRSQPQAFATAIDAIPTLAPSSCDETCQKAIIEEIQNKSVQSSIPVFTDNRQDQNGTHEYYIPLGNGKTVSQDWEFSPSAEVYIDTSNYPTIKKVIFEAYLSIPTANGFVSAKLYNVTDQHDVWFSEVVMETNTVTRKEKTISLDKGNKLYRVMLKSSMGYEAILHNARIKIQTE